MWFLQRRNTHNQIFLTGILIAIAHIALLLCLFFVYHDVAQHLELRIMPNVMPREIEFRVAVERIASKKGASGKTVAKAVTLPPAKKMPLKSTRIASASPKKSAKQAVAKKSAPAKAVAKKVESSLRPLGFQPSPGATADKTAGRGGNGDVAQKKEPEKIESSLRPLEATADRVANGVASAQPESDHINFDLSQKGFPAMFEAEYQALYENLSDQWTPPSGIPVTSQCVITVVVDKQGEVEDMLVDNSSGMMVFDLAARSALSEVEFPRFVWGKSITVTFSV